MLTINDEVPKMLSIISIMLTICSVLSSNVKDLGNYYEENAVMKISFEEKLEYYSNLNSLETDYKLSKDNDEKDKIKQEINSLKLDYQIDGDNEKEEKEVYRAVKYSIIPPIIMMLAGVVLIPLIMFRDS